MAPDCSDAVFLNRMCVLLFCLLRVCVQRAPKDVDRVPMTSRVSGVAGKSNRLSEVSHIPSFSSSSTSRQGGVYGGSKHASGAVTARPAATGRSGTRWK
jgi:hypothetical protein